MINNHHEKKVEQFPGTSWLIQYVEELSETNFIDLTENRSKFQSDVLVEVPSSRTIGILITKLFQGSSGTQFHANHFPGHY